MVLPLKCFEGACTDRKASFDVTVFRCTNCVVFYVDASWYAVALESDIECGVCHTNFNAKKELTDRALLEFTINEKGKIREVMINKHLPSKENNK